MEINFVAVDVETTGLSCTQNELIEISAIKYIDLKKEEIFSTLVKPKIKIPSYITKITGINNQMVKNSPEIESVMPKLIKFIGDFPIVAHNARFDYGFLQSNSKKAFSKNKLIDTVVISRILAPNLENHKLGTVAKFIGITEEGFHRAEFDCECCCTNIYKIFKKYKKRKLKF